MKTSILLLASTFVTPALAHEVPASHSHLGEAVLLHISPLFAAGAGVVALIALAALRVRGGGKAREERNDSR